MAEPRKLQTERNCPASLPYRVELRGANGEVATVLAEGSSPGIAYAAYYAAVREYFGRHLTLSHGDRKLAGSGEPSR